MDRRHGFVGLATLAAAAAVVAGTFTDAEDAMADAGPTTRIGRAMEDGRPAERRDDYRSADLRALVESALDAATARQSTKAVDAVNLFADLRRGDLLGRCLSADNPNVRGLAMEAVPGLPLEEQARALAASLPVEATFLREQKVGELIAARDVFLERYQRWAADVSRAVGLPPGAAADVVNDGTARRALLQRLQQLHERTDDAPGVPPKPSAVGGRN